MGPNVSCGQYIGYVMGIVLNPFPFLSKSPVARRGQTHTSGVHKRLQHPGQDQAGAIYSRMPFLERLFHRIHKGGKSAMKMSFNSREERIYYGTDFGNCLMKMGRGRNIYLV